MNHRKAAAAALIATLLVTGAAGCGSDDEAGEKASEKLAEEMLGGDVDIDAEDGSVKVTDEEGNTSQYGGGAELPEDWPADLAPPEEVTILGSSTRTQDGVETMNVTGESETSLDDLFAGVKQQLTDAGYELGDDTTMSSGTSGFASVEATSDEFTANVTVSEDPATNKTTILFNLTQNAA